jgi:long-subunit acyl-CoA synthetase (AMP-forming)
MRAGNSGHPATGARRLRAGLAALGWSEQTGENVLPEHRALAARLVMSLAHLESEQGHAEYGQRLLDGVELYVASSDSGTLHLQRGLILLRTGRWQRSLIEFNAAEPLLTADSERLAATLLNRGVLYLNTGNVRLARSDLRRAEDVAAGAGVELIAAMAIHNQGYCDLLIGDIPTALHLFDLAAAVYGRIAPGVLHTLRTDRARALLATGDLAVARRWATAAMRRFRARGNDAWAVLAELTRLRSTIGVAFGAWDAQAPRRWHHPARVADKTGQLAERLRSYGLRADAKRAELIAARAFIAAGRRDDGARRLAAARTGRDLPLDVALLRRLARAELAILDGYRGRALDELRNGMNMLHMRRGQLGSADLQTGAAALGTELADAGLRLVLDRGSAWQVFAWLERSRAQAFRVRPVLPPADPEEAAVLAELRQLSTMIRTGELNGMPDPASIARNAELQRVVRQRSWRAAGPRETIAEATPREVGQALGESGQVYAGILVRDGRMLAVTVSGAGTGAGAKVQLLDLGDFAAATEAARRLTADLDALAGRKLPSRLEVVIKDSIRHQTGILSENVVAPLLPVLKDNGTVIVPVGALASVPWSMLPGLRGRPVAIAPSASSWLSAWRGLRSAGEADVHRSKNLRPLLVAGPDLRHAIPEITEIAVIYPGSTALVARAATVEDTLRALDGAGLAHLAAHGHHDRDNVLFSRLDLADGPLMAYDIQRLATAPMQVVLSACDVGRTVVRPGDEILGFTAALLHIGTPTVISSVTRVADDAPASVMTAYHRALRSGARPAEALAKASEAEDLCPFVCFGAGLSRSAVLHVSDHPPRPLYWRGMIGLLRPAPGQARRTGDCGGASALWAALASPSKPEPASKPVSRRRSSRIAAVRDTMACMTDPVIEADPAIKAERAAIEADITGSTLLTAYAETVAANEAAEAHRWRDEAGAWHSLTYRQVHGKVRDLTLGLAAIGFQPGDFAVIWSGNRSEATIADYAVMHARGVPVFIYNTVSPEQAAYIAGHCEATVAIVERQYLPKLIQIRDQLPKLREIILIDGDGDGDGDDESARSWNDVLAQGNVANQADPGQFDRTWQKVAPDDLVTLIYTSGTTGTPKAVMISHHNVRYYQGAVNLILPPQEQDDGIPLVISYLPMAHVTGRSVDHWSAMNRALTLVYCPDVLKLFEYAGQVHPTGIMGIPRVWEKLYAALRNALPTTDPEKIRALPDEARHGILTMIGLDRCLIATSGSAPLDPGIIEFFRALGVPLTEGWGMSELSNAATIAPPDQSRVGTVGRHFPGMEIKIAADGEILVRGPLVMGGYYKDPERTVESVDSAGWLHTGDIGELDADGYLKITDRKKELIITSGGKNISPALIEYELQRHPLIGQACAIGDRRNYVTALIVLDPEAAPAWAREHGVEAASLAELASHPDVLAEVERGVAEANSHLARAEQVRRFRVLGQEWTSASGELTPTMKRRRSVIVERYAKEIDQLYA